MRNVIIVDIDTDRENVITFGKPSDIPQPQNKEEAQEMVLNDISCLSEAITTLIQMASQNGFGDLQTLVANSIKPIASLLTSEPIDNNVTDTLNPSTDEL